jgi:hypothetical protein
MKKLLLALALITLLTSCCDEDETTSNPQFIYKINGKKYKFIKIAPNEYDRDVWIFIPLDTNTQTPEVIVTKQPYGKSTYNQSTIILK